MLSTYFKVKIEAKTHSKITPIEDLIMASLSTVDFYLNEENQNKKSLTENSVKYKRIDLHSHTYFSDGGLSPELLLDRAINYQLDVLAITDHDTISGLEVAHHYLQKLSDESKKTLTLINGIEISTAWQGFEIHIVGLNIDTKNDALLKLISEQQQARELRAKAMGEKLAKCGFDNIYQEAKTLAGKGTITRAHFAKVLYQQGHVATLQKAFDKYIGKGQKAFVKPNWCSIETAVDIIHQSGGSAVMAHPIRYDLTAKWLRRLIVEFKTCLGDGLEIVLPQMNPQQRQTMLNYCIEYDLCGSMGSDFHHPSKWVDLGRNLTLPESVKPIWSLWFK